MCIRSSTKLQDWFPSSRSFPALLLWSGAHFLKSELIQWSALLETAGEEATWILASFKTALQAKDQAAIFCPWCTDFINSGQFFYYCSLAIVRITSELNHCNAFYTGLSVEASSEALVNRKFSTHKQAGINSLIHIITSLASIPLSNTNQDGLPTHVDMTQRLPGFL